MSQPEVPRLPMPTWLDVLRAVLPVRGVLLVGAGMGNGPWVQWLKDRRISPVHLVEGDQRQYQHLTSSLPRIDGWTSWRDVAAANTDPVTFYHASNPAESGLVQPEALREFWPHLDTEHSAMADAAITLDGLDAVTDSAINWLILDCLPAADLLQGGRQLLTKVDVALVRVVLGQGNTLETARHDAVDSVLRAAGLTCCHVQAERNPALAHALYVRDTSHQARTAQEQMRQAHDLLKQEKQTLEKCSQELERAKAVLEQERQAAAKHQETTAELTANQDQETQLLRQANDLLEQKNHTLEERNHELQRVQALLEQERQAAAKHQKTTAELIANQGQEIQRLRQANDLLEQENQTLEERSQELERVQALLEQEMQAAAMHQKKAAELTVNQSQEMQRLRQVNDLLEQKSQALEERSHELEYVKVLLKQEKQALEECGQELERAQALLEQERQAAAKHQEQAAELAVSQGQEMQQLRQAHALLEQKNQTLEEHSQGLERVKALLEQDKQALIEQWRNIEILNAENISRVSEIASEAKTQNAQIEKAVQNLKQQVDTGLKNAVKQIESYIGIESYLAHGNLALPMHGWPVSADFALCLIGLIETRHYDLIIEFGSGTSTVLMARVMAKMMKQRQPMKRLAGQETISYEETPGAPRSPVSHQNRSTLIEPWPLILSFEHNRKFYDETLNRLHQERLEKFVELSHSPLRDYVSASGDHFLYYACEEKFAILAKQLVGRRARILVVVDGPPGTTNHHARYPAMPIILQHLAEHQLDVLLDDYSRKEEKEIVDRWVELLDQRSLKYEKQNLAFEKGAYLLLVG